MTEPTFAGRVSRWYEQHARDLPWRRPEADPWAILVSEVMLQQTRSPGWCPPGRRGWSAGRHRPPWPGRARPRRSGCGDGSVIPVARSGCTSARWPSWSGTAVRCRTGWNSCSPCPASVRTPPGRSPPSRTASVTRWSTPTYAGWFAGRWPVNRMRPDHPPGRSGRHRGTAARRTGRSRPGQRRLHGVGGGRLHRPVARCGVCPVESTCAWRAAGRPAPAGPTRRPQRYAGTDRQVRGLLLGVLREASGPVPHQRLDQVWADDVQRARALAGLVDDGLVEPIGATSFRLVGDGPPAPVAG